MLSHGYGRHWQRVNRTVEKSTEWKRRRAFTQLWRKRGLAGREVITENQVNRTPTTCRPVAASVTRQVYSSAVNSIQLCQESSSQRQFLTQESANGLFTVTVPNHQHCCAGNDLTSAPRTLTRTRCRTGGLQGSGKVKRTGTAAIAVAVPTSCYAHALVLYRISLISTLPFLGSKKGLPSFTPTVP